MVGRTSNGTSLRPRILKALSQAKLSPEDRELAESYVKLVASVVEKNVNLKNGDKSKITVRFLKNIAILKIAFGFTNENVADALLGKHSNLERTIKLRQREISMLANAYGSAQHRFPKLKDILTSGVPSEEMDLELLVAPADTSFGQSVPAIPLHMARLLESTRWSDKFQSGDPNAICRVAEQYISIGAYEIAETLLEDLLATVPDDPGAWFQKASLMLKKSSAAMQEAARLRIISGEGGALSATEQHFDDLACADVVASRTLRRQAFETCLKAYSLLPDRLDYESSALEWSRDHGTLRQLRCNIVTFIIQQAGESCNPYWESGDLHERIEARLGRTRRYIFGDRPDDDELTTGWVPDSGRMAELAAQPLFSESADKLVVLAYEEFKRIPSAFIENRTLLQFHAMNFLRVLVPPAVYREEVEDFVKNLGGEYAPLAGQYFGAFPGPSDPGDRRKVLHEHLDAIMSHDQQRAFVRQIYDKCVAEVHGRQDQALSSIYDEEIDRKFSAGNVWGAYQSACQAESEKVYRRDEGWGALVLTRLAQRVSRHLGSGADMPASVARHIDDEAMIKIAEDCYRELLSEGDARDSIDLPYEYLWALDGG